MNHLGRQVQLFPAVEGGAHVQVGQARHRLHGGQHPVHAGGHWEHPQDLPAGDIKSIRYLLVWKRFDQHET